MGLRYNRQICASFLITNNLIYIAQRIIQYKTLNQRRNQFVRPTPTQLMKLTTYIYDRVAHSWSKSFLVQFFLYFTLLFSYTLSIF